MKCEYEFSAAYLSVVQLFIWNLHEYFVTSHLNSNMLCRHDDREISTYVTIIIAMNAVKKQQPQITKSYRLFTCLIITWLRSTLRSAFVSVRFGVEYLFLLVFLCYNFQRQVNAMQNLCSNLGGPTPERHFCIYCSIFHIFRPSSNRTSDDICSILSTVEKKSYKI